MDRWLSRPREGVTITLGERHGEAPEEAADLATATVTPCAVSDARAHIGRTVLIHALVDGHDAEIICDLGLVQTLVKHVFGDIDQSLLGSSERALVLEHALGAMVALLERDFDMAVRFEWAAQDVESDLPVVGAASVTLPGKTRPGHVIIHGLDAVGMLFRNFVEHCPPGPPVRVRSNIHVSLVFGSTVISVAEMRGLSAGDTILVDECFESDKPLRAVAGKALIAPARFSGPRIEAVAEFAPPKAGAGFRWLVEPPQGVNVNMPDPENLMTNSLGDMKVRLVFEIGRAEISVADIEKLGPGYVFDVTRATDGHVDIIAGGRVIGSGEIVKIGDEIGIRLKRIAS